jgi:hypothetical protein
VEGDVHFVNNLSVLNLPYREDRVSFDNFLSLSCQEGKVDKYSTSSVLVKSTSGH